MTRDELVEAGADSLPGGNLRRNRESAAAVIAKVESLIRADLRAKIEALPIWEDSQGWLVMSYADVVALIGLRAPVLSIVRGGLTRGRLRARVMSTIVEARKPEPGEVCTCGRPAIIVYLTEDFGPVGYCGIPGPAS